MTMPQTDPTHRFQIKAFYPGQQVDDLAAGGTKSKPNPGVFDYQRQQEWKTWEEIRGVLTIDGQGIFDGEGNIVNGEFIKTLVQGSYPYYVNPLLYDEIRIRKIGAQDSKQNSRVFMSSEAGNKTRVQIVGPVFLYYKSWFQWTFRHTYNWESATYFPVDTTRNFQLRPDYLFPAYDDTLVTPSNIAYDPGAWAGFKDDIASFEGDRVMKWRTNVPFLPQSSNPDRGGTGRDDANIFLEQHAPVASISILAGVGSGSADITTPVLVSVVFINDRRLTPVAGH
jgi:hypothetical protein